MIACLLLAVMLITFPTMPIIAGLALLGAFYSAMYWWVGTDLIEMIFFYGAIAGCLVGVFH